MISQSYVELQFGRMDKLEHFRLGKKLSHVNNPTKLGLIETRTLMSYHCLNGHRHRTHLFIARDGAPVFVILEEPVSLNFSSLLLKQS